MRDEKQRVKKALMTIALRTLTYVHLLHAIRAVAESVDRVGIDNLTLLTKL